MAAINKLTIQDVQRIARASAEAPPEAPKKHMDGGGLFLLATPSGALLWRMKFRIAGVEKKLSFGAYPAVSLVDARAARDEAKRQLGAGLDPAAEKQALKAAEAAKEEAPTFGRFAKEVLAREAQRQDPKTTAKWDLHMSYAVAEFGERPIADIRAAEVLAFLEHFQGNGQMHTMHSVKQKMGKVFDRAVRAEARAGNPIPSLRGELLPPKDKSHAAIVDPARFGDLIRMVDGMNGSRSVRGALLFLALTFQRPGMVLDARWAHINWEAKRWEIPAAFMKGEAENKRDHVVPLAEPALAVLRAMLPFSGDSDLIFPGRSGEKPLSNNALNKALRDKGIGSHEHVGHGFRASANTMIKEHLKREMAEALVAVVGGGTDLQELIDLQLAHVVGNQTRRAYDRVKLIEERTVLMEVWATFIEACRRRDPKVVKLKAAKA